MDKNKLIEYENLIKDYAKKHYVDLFREPDGILKHKFIVPGSGYAHSLWDWDSWFIEQALEHITQEDITEYEKGCLLNFIDHQFNDGRIPIFITSKTYRPEFKEGEASNLHKPILCQRALYISNKIGDFTWLKPHLGSFEKFINYYENNCKHESGLYFWVNDYAIGVDNDPCTFFRPANSSASILLNCFMYKELLDLSTIMKELKEKEKEILYKNKAQQLKDAIINHCYDERDGFFYNVDINLLPIDPNQVLHRGAPRHYSTLIQRIGVWSGFMAMLYGIATPEQAERMVKEHALNEKTFCSDYGIRSLSKMEKMYAILPSNNPSCWLGPVWGLCNWVVYEGMKRYGYIEEAKQLAYKTIKLFGEDLAKTGEIHEFYHPETGETVFNKGFQSWNLFAVEMVNWLKENI